MDYTLAWTVVVAVLLAGISYGGLYVLARGNAVSTRALEQRVEHEFRLVRAEIRLVEDKEAEHTSEVIQRLSRIEANIDVLVKQLDKVTGA